MKRTMGMILLVLLTGILSQSVYAESSVAVEKPWEKFSLNLGGFISNIDSDLRVGAKGLAVSIDMEDRTGVDSTQSSFRTGAVWRFSENRRHRFDLSWHAFRRDSTREVLNDFDVQAPDGSSVTVPAGTTVKSYFDLDIYRGAYSYSFFQDHRVDLGGSIGMFVMPVSAGLNAVGVVDVKDSASFTAPMPVFGLRADVAITPKWFLRFGSELFYLEYMDFKGTLFNASTRVEYNPWKHVGLGLGVESFRLNIESEGNDYGGIDFKGELGFNYTGIEIYTKVFF